MFCSSFLFFFQAEDGIRDIGVTGVQTALPIYILGSIPRGIEKSGALAGQIAEKLVGSSATSLAGRSGQKAIAGAARAIAEGGLWGAGSEASAATLENRDLTAESVISSAGHGALLGW